MSEEKQRPRIAISGAQTKDGEGVVAGSASVKAMAELIRRSGGEPVIINHSKPESADRFDGLVLMGNDYDISPHLSAPGRPVHDATHSEIDPAAAPNGRPVRSEAEMILARRRADYEWEAMKIAEREHIPVFGVCGGLQRINVALKGELIQHVEDADPRSKGGAIDHSAPVKTVSILLESHLHHLSERAGLTEQVKHVDEAGNPFGVNSFHHQVVRPSHYGQHLKVAAVSEDKNPDGTGRMLIEALEGDNPDWYLMGVQWHPEFMPEARLSQELIGQFVSAAQARQTSKPELSAAMASALRTPDPGATLTH